MKELLSRVQGPLGVFAFNDTLAFGTMPAVKDKGLSIPSDIAFVGYDDIPMAAYAEPPLSTVGQPIEAMCEEGVQMLLGILNGDLPHDFYKKTVLEPKLIIRHSCACS